MALLDEHNQSRGDQDASRPPATGKGLRAILPYTTVLTIVVALYAGWTVWSRHESAVEATRQAQEKAAAAEQERAADITAHGELTFTTFYASNAIVKRGESTRLCYGVMNAASVKLDPPVEPLHVTARHCLDISPVKTTTYTITATDSAGQSKSLSVTVRVK
jgi:hypothetical protein